MAFTYLKVKPAKFFCILPVVLILVLLFWSWSCKQRSWSWYCYFGLGLQNLVLFTTLATMGLSRAVYELDDEIANFSTPCIGVPLEICNSGGASKTMPLAECQKL